MKILFILLMLVSTLAQAKVEVCYRKAHIMFGLVNHYWLKTDTVTAGMGSGNPEIKNIGDQFEYPGIKVYVIDHTDQVPDVCRETVNHDEQCINEKLVIGKQIGRFTPTNNCQTFVHSVLKSCEKPEYTLAKKEKREYLNLLNQEMLTPDQELRLKELEEKYKF